MSAQIPEYSNTSNKGRFRAGDSLHQISGRGRDGQGLHLGFILGNTFS